VNAEKPGAVGSDRSLAANQLAATAGEERRRGMEWREIVLRTLAVFLAVHYDPRNPERLLASGNKSWGASGGSGVKQVLKRATNWEEKP